MFPSSQFSVRSHPTFPPFATTRAFGPLSDNTLQQLPKPNDNPLSALELTNFGIAYAEQIVLSDVNLSIPLRGVTTLLGPTGTGKSTLLRTIAGFNRHLPSLRVWGVANFCGKPLSESNNPVLVSQNTRLLTSTLLDNLLYDMPEQFAATGDEKRTRAVDNLCKVALEGLRDFLSQPVVELPLATQRLVSIARTIATDPSLVLIDEPTFGLEEEDANTILDVIQRQAAERAILVVLHNQRQALALGGNVALLAGGVIQESSLAERFFKAPTTAAGKEFVATGSCSDPSPGANEDELSTGIRPRLRPPPRDLEIPSETVGPRGFVWLIPGQLAGTPLPGVVSSVQHDLKGLKRVNVTALISLTSTPLDAAALAEYRMTAHWFPIPDMGAPDMQMAREICTTIDRLRADNAVIAVHCRAGLGRTGTILVAYLIWRGQTAMDALETARRFEPKWVQSETQIQFLERFARELQSSEADHRKYG